MEASPAQCSSLTKRGERCKNRASIDGLCVRHATREGSVFSQERAVHLAAVISAGNSTAVALRVCGISKTTFQNWMRRGGRGESPYEAFRLDIQRARASAEARHVTQVAAAAVDDWRAASYMLDRQLRRRDDVEDEATEDTSDLAAEVAASAAEEARRTLTAIGEDSELSEGAIDRYVAAVVVWKMLEAGWVKLGRPATTLGGATGLSQVAHPLIGQMAAARRECAELGAAIGLDVRSRLRLNRRVGAGRPAGAASALDRSQPPMRLVKGGAE
jgi:hypothetical protein